MKAQAQLQQMTPEQQQAQVVRARAINGMQKGLEFLIDETVVGPMKYADGVADLKWLLRGLLSGQFSLNLDPQAAGPSSATGKPLSDYDETEGKGEAEAE